MAQKLTDFYSNLLFPHHQLQIEYTDGFVILHKAWYSLE